MKTNWDYTELATAYLKRPAYAELALDEMLAASGVDKTGKVCDVGAGTGILTSALARRELVVDAVEPNDAMRAHGIQQTGNFAGVCWFEGAGEVTGRPDSHYDLVTFGSSFNVTDRQAALLETHRILKPRGWFACMWNHRNLSDPHQGRVETIIRDFLPEYGHGSRREDQMPVLNKSGLFSELHFAEADRLHRVAVVDQIEAWRSHATLARQAGDRFTEVVDTIATYLNSLGETMDVPYTTRLWYGRMTS